MMRPGYAHIDVLTPYALENFTFLALEGLDFKVSLPEKEARLQSF